MSGPTVSHVLHKNTRCLHAKSYPSLCNPVDCSPSAPLSMGFSRQESWSGLLCPPPGDLPDPGIKPASLMSSALAGRFFTTSVTWEVPLSRKSPPQPQSTSSLLSLSLDKLASFSHWRFLREGAAFPEQVQGQAQRRHSEKACQVNTTAGESQRSRPGQPLRDSQRLPQGAVEQQRRGSRRRWRLQSKGVM